MRRRPRDLASTIAKYERRRVSLVLTREQREAIDKLLATGVFGLSTAAFLREVLNDYLRARTSEGWLEYPPRIVERKSRRR